jgi:hypothetical protein
VWKSIQHLDEKLNNLDDKFSRDRECEKTRNFGNEKLNISNLKTQWKALKVDQPE